MLEPTNRRLLLDALRPPAGSDLDLAIGTTFTLDLYSLLAAPLAFAMFDWESESDGEPIGSPIASLEAVRRYSERIHVFCQAGEISIPKDYRHLIAYLEGSIHEVVAPPGGIFHPKLWVLRFRETATERFSYRVLCLTRNMTFDRAWDTILSLEAESQAKVVHQRGNEPLANFLGSLASMTLRPLDVVTQEALISLGDGLQNAQFVLPSGVERIAFHPLGMAGKPRWPFDQYDRLLVMSPFLTAEAAKRFSDLAPRATIISRPESLDRVGAAGLQGFQDTYVLDPGALPIEDAQDSEPTISGPTEEVVAEASPIELTGLHGKLYVTESADTATIWTGSANATTAGFGSNTEFIVALEGQRNLLGVDALLGVDSKELRLLDLLRSYPPASEPIEPSAEEQAELALDQAARAIASMHFTASIAEAEDEQFTSTLHSSGDLAASTMVGIEGRVWPISMKRDLAGTNLISGAPVESTFGPHTFETVTSFFAFELRASAAPKQWPKRFVINAELVGAPTDRKERLLATLLQSASDFLAYLRFLLADLTDVQGFLASMEGDEGAAFGFIGAGNSPVFESLLKALSTDPARLDHVARLLDDLEKTPDAASRLPDGFLRIWQPIWEARQALK